MMLACQQLMDLQLVLFLLLDLTLTCPPHQPRLQLSLLHQHGRNVVERMMEGVRILEGRVGLVPYEPFVHFVDVEGLEKVGVV